MTAPTDEAQDEHRPHIWWEIEMHPDDRLRMRSWSGIPPEGVRTATPDGTIMISYQAVGVSLIRRTPHSTEADQVRTYDIEAHPPHGEDGVAVRIVREGVTRHLRVRTCGDLGQPDAQMDGWHPVPDLEELLDA